LRFAILPLEFREHYYPNLDRAESTVEASSPASLKRRKRRSALCPRHAVVVLVCSSKEQPLVSSVMRCCAASVMGLALEVFQLVEKTRDLRGFKDELGTLAASGPAVA
jgi:hypothetical protein